MVGYVLMREGRGSFAADAQGDQAFKVIKLLYFD
jgi:hypothetical protein